MIESGRRRSLRASIALYLCLGVYLVVVTFPFYYMVLTSLRPMSDVYRREHMLMPANITLLNYVRVLTDTSDLQDSSLSRLMIWSKNSIIVAFSSTTISLLIAMLAAYALARLRFFGSRALAKLVLFMYLLPSSLLFIPLFLILSNLEITNTLWALIVSYQTINVPFMAWLLLGYFRTIPVELEDAARIDGCSRVGVLWRLVLPLALPGIVAAFIFGFINSWNEFLYAAVMVQRTELRTIPVGLYSFKIGDVMLWGPLMASAVMVTLPVAILLMFVQRYFVQGLTVGGVKG